MPEEPHPEKSASQAKQAVDTAKADFQRTLPEKLDLHISLEGIPNEITNAIARFAKPTETASKLKSFLKDYLPALTPIATAVISVAISVYTYKANDHRSKDAIDKTVSEFGSKNLDERGREVAAIKLAKYGEVALPAVHMALGANDLDLRTGGELVAQQMYRAKTVDRGKLTKEILGYYAENDRPLRLGVVEWLVMMEHQLSADDSRLAYEMVQNNFRGELCTLQDDDVALQAAKFLYIWCFSDSKALVVGMAEHCPGAGTQEQAVNTLPVLAKNLPQTERASLLNDALPRLRKSRPELKDLIDQAETKIRAISQ